MTPESDGSWSRLAILLLLGAVLVPRSPSTPAEDSTAAKSAAIAAFAAPPASSAVPAPSATPGASALQNEPAPESAPLLRTLDAVAGFARPSTSAEEFRRRFLVVGTVSALVVGIPDPRRSHMALYFDQSLSALRRGAEALGYSQDQFVLPWSKAGKTEGEPGTSTDSSRKTPGLLVFRAGNALLVALLVSESPMLGPATDQLHRALDVAWALNAPDRPLPVLGPFFSASARGFELALRDWHDDKPRATARMITGTATASAPERLADLDFVTFERTVPRDDELVSFVFDQLRGQPKLAFLSESGTVYGEALARKPDATEALPLPKGRHFKFPLHISALRAALEKQDKTDSTSPSLRRTLALKLDAEEDTLPDAPPHYSALTPYVEELSLGQELVRICHDRVSHLVIQATDPADVIFLSQEAGKYCPGIGLVALASEQLFTHPDLRSSLSGLLVGTSYPLLFSSRPWVDAEQPAPFDSQVSQGLYNAFVALAHEQLERTTPPPLFGYAGDCEGPHLWLTLLANGTYWPLATACSKVADRFSYRPKAVPAAARPVRLPKAPGFAKAVGALVLFVSLVHLSAWLLASLRRTWHIPVAGIFRHTSAARAVTQQRYLVAAHLSLCVMLTLMLPAALRASELPRGTFGSIFWVCTRAGAAAAVVLGLAAAFTWVRLLRNLWTPPGRWGSALAHTRCTALFSSACMLWLLAASYWFVEDQRFSTSIADRFALTRFLNPAGMSPLSPLFYLAAGFYFWSVSGLRRIRGLERFSRLAPITLARSPRQPTRAGQSLKALLDALRGVWWGRNWPYEVTVLVLFALMGGYFWKRTAPTFDGPAFDCLFKSAFTVLYGAIGFAFIHFVLLSRLLLSFTLKVAGHPMIDAYDRIATKVSGTFGLRFAARVPPAEELEISARSAALLANMIVAAAPDADATHRLLSSARPALEKQAGLLSKALSKLATSLGDRAAAERAFHECLFSTSRRLFALLEQLWVLRAAEPARAEFAKIPVDDLLPKGDRDKLPTVAVLMRTVPHDVYLWMRTAEDFVAMRVATFIYHALYQLRNLLTFAITAAFLLVLCVGAYPFQPSRFVIVFTWAPMLVVVGGALVQIVRMERNEILSRIGGSSPGRVDFNVGFIKQIALYVVFPILAIVARTFPEIGDPVFSWLGSAQRLIP